MNALIREWQAAESALKEAKALELKLRKRVIEKNPGDLGTSHYPAGKDHEIVITRGVTLSTDKEYLEMIWDELTEEERECIDYKPSVIKKKYTELPEDSYLREAVTVRPSLPTVKIKEV